MRGLRLQMNLDLVKHSDYVTHSDLQTSMLKHSGLLTRKLMRLGSGLMRDSSWLMATETLIRWHFQIRSG